MTDKLYPEIEPKVCEQSSILTQADVISKISKERINLMLSEIGNMKNNLKHYNKLAHRYLVLKRILRYSGIGVRTSLEVIAVIIELASLSIALPISAGLIIGGIASPALTEALNKLLDSKRNKYLKKSRNITHYLDRLYIFCKEAADDKEISLLELKQFQDIIKEYQGKQEQIKVNGQTSSANEASIQDQLKLISAQIMKLKLN